MRISWLFISSVDQFSYIKLSSGPPEFQRPLNMKDSTSVTSEYEVTALFNRIALVLFITNIIISILVLFGWELSIEFLKHPISHMSMNPASAIGFLILGLLLLTISLNRKRGNGQMLVYFFASIPALIGLTKLLGISFDLGFQIDLLLFTEAIQEEKGIFNSDMAPNTAFNLVLLGAAILLFLQQHKFIKSLSNYIASIVFLSGLFAVTGYLYEVKEFYGILSYIPMPIHSAICIILLSLGILFLNAQAGFMKIISSHYSGGVIAYCHHSPYRVWLCTLATATTLSDFHRIGCRFPDHLHRPTVFISDSICFVCNQQERHVTKRSARSAGGQ